VKALGALPLIVSRQNPTPWVDVRESTSRRPGLAEDAQALPETSTFAPVSMLVKPSADKAFHSKYTCCRPYLSATGRENLF